MFFYTATDGTPTFKNYYPASTTALGSGDIEAYIYDDPNQLFVVQADGASTMQLSAEMQILMVLVVVQQLA